MMPRMSNQPKLQTMSLICYSRSLEQLIAQTYSAAQTHYTYKDWRTMVVEECFSEFYQMPIVKTQQHHPHWSEMRNRFIEVESWFGMALRSDVETQFLHVLPTDREYFLEIADFYYHIQPCK